MFNRRAGPTQRHVVSRAEQPGGGTGGLSLLTQLPGAGVGARIPRTEDKGLMFRCVRSLADLGCAAPVFSFAKLRF